MKHNNNGNVFKSNKYWQNKVFQKSMEKEQIIFRKHGKEQTYLAIVKFISKLQN